MGDSLAREDVNAEPSVIEVLNEDGATSESSYELDIAVVKKVIVLASEASMGLLLDLEDDITSLNAGCLITLAAELDLGAAADTLVDVDMEDLAVDNGLLAVALLAAVLLLNDLTVSVAVGADSLEALDHGTHLAHHSLHTVAVAAGASLHGALFTTEAVALGADDGPLQRQLRDLAPVHILKRDLVSVVNGSGLGRASLVHATATEHATEATTEATSAEELGEEVLGGHAAAAGAALETSLAILIINLSLLRIGEDFVSVRNLLELVLSFGVVGVLVWSVSAAVYTISCAAMENLPGWYFKAPVL